MNNKKVLRKCPKCRKTYTLGLNGIKGQCDKCAGVVRDSKGYIWLPGENDHQLMSVVTGEIHTEQRPQEAPHD